MCGVLCCPGGDPFNELTLGDGCALAPYPNATVRALLASSPRARTLLTRSRARALVVGAQRRACAQKQS